MLSNEYLFISQEGCFLKYKLIAFDLDGTILDDDKRIPPDNLRALEAAAAQGVIIVTATGRILDGIPDEIKALPFIRYFVTINGAYVYDRVLDAAAFRAEIPLELALRTYEYAADFPVLYDCYQDDMGWMDRSMLERAPEYFTTEPRMLELLNQLRRPVGNLPQLLRERGRSVQKIQMYFTQEDMPLRQRLLDEMPGLFPELLVFSSVKNNIELNSVASGKDKALAALCESLGFTMESVVAFGDGSNDCGMLRAAGLGIAMANADPEVLAAADAVTASNNEAGLAQMIWKLLDEN